MLSEKHAGIKMFNNLPSDPKSLKKENAQFEIQLK
jgi:hypothetical protein